MSILRKTPRGPLYLCEDMDLTTSQQELDDFVFLWEQGHSVKNIATFLKRPTDEILLMIVDQASKEVITARPGGIFGRLYN